MNVGEDGLDGTQINGTGPAAAGAGVGTGGGKGTVKQSPRVGGKRQKGNP